MRKPILTFGVLCAAIGMVSSTAYSGEASLPIRVTLVKCGDSRADLPRACKTDSRCCVFLDDADLPEDNMSAAPSNAAPQFTKVSFRTPHSTNGAFE